jgi:alcohol dehydrogenase class IV
MFPVPHGVACGRLLPLVMEANVRALRARAPDSPALARYDEVARLLTGRPEATAEEGAARVRELVEELDVPALATYGVGEEQVEEVVAKARRASSMQGNPVVLTDDELAEVLRAAANPDPSAVRLPESGAAASTGIAGGIRGRDGAPTLD